jgi:hypothetical protein
MVIMTGTTGGVSLRLKKFNLDEMNPLAVIVAIGKRRSGKSFLLRDLLSRHQSIPVGLVMSATEMANKFFGDFVPGCFIHEGFVENARFTSLPTKRSRRR